MKLSYTRRIYLSFATVFAVCLPLFATSYFSVRTMNEEAAELSKHEVQNLILTERLVHAIDSEFSAMPLFMLSGRQPELDRYLDARRSFADIFAAIQRSNRSAEARDILAQIAAGETRLYAAGQAAVALRRRGGSAVRADRMLRDAVGPLSPRLLDLAARLQTLEQGAYRTAHANAAAVAARILQTALITSLSAVVAFASVFALVVVTLKRKREIDLANERLLGQRTRLANARKEVVETVAHDLKNPLATASIAMELLNRRLTAPGPVTAASLRGLIDNAANALQSMTRLISATLDHSKIEAGHLALEKAPCQPSALLEECRRSFALLAEKKFISLTVTGRGDLPTLHCDFTRIWQVLGNLVGNALKFTPAHGCIEVTAEFRDEHLFFAVADSGPGLGSEQALHIFERFWQAPATARSGSGLGLAIAKGIVEAHGGRLWVESQPGAGATFRFCLPSRVPETSALADISTNSIGLKEAISQF